MQIMGDLGKRANFLLPARSEKDYGCTILATAGHGFVFGGDVFAFPKQKDAAASKTQAALAKCAARSGNADSVLPEKGVAACAA